MESKGASLHIFKHVLNVYSSLFMQVSFFFLIWLCACRWKTSWRTSCPTFSRPTVRRSYSVGYVSAPAHTQKSMCWTSPPAGPTVWLSTAFYTTSGEEKIESGGYWSMKCGHGNKHYLLLWPVKTNNRLRSWHSCLFFLFLCILLKMDWVVAV